jgi:hypothetical protein
VVVLRRKLAVLLVAMVVVLALGIGLLGAVGSASPDDNADNRSDKGRTLTVLTKTREIEVLDLGAQGPSQGDLRVVNAPLYNESGKERIGRFDLFCVTTDPADEPNERAHMVECTYAYTLPGGEINAQGVRAYPKLSEPVPRSVDALSGGTGKYAGVRGEVHVETRGTKVTSTFRFIG